MPSLQEVMTSARRKLVTDPDFATLLGTDIGRDIPGTGPFTDGWVFLGHDAYDAPERHPANTGKAAVVLSMRRPWASPNRHNTARFKLLRVRIYADQTRALDTALSAVKDAEFRCDRIATKVINVFHDALNVDHLWPNDVFIISSVLYNDLNIDDEENDDGLVVGDLEFALELD